MLKLRGSRRMRSTTNILAIVRKSLFSGSLILCSLGAAQANEQSYTLFEAGQVRPLAISDNGKHLFAVNTPDNRIEAYKITAQGLVHKGSVQVGLEPVAIGLYSNDQIWVVNHVSDSISIVDTGNLEAMRVTRTLLVGDEPRDIVFAGKNRRYAFITTAHRGQNAPFDPQLTTPGVGRADVWVFKAADPGAGLGGTPENIITLFTDTPRALAVSADGSRVYAAGFKTGNQTTVLHEAIVTANGGLPGAYLYLDFDNDGTPDSGPHPISTQAYPQLMTPVVLHLISDPDPAIGDHWKDDNGVNRDDLIAAMQPLTSLIVRYNGSHWLDEIGRVWDDQVKFSLPDRDVFVIDAGAKPPRALGGSAGYYSGVGTVLFNMAVNPVSGKVYVSNLEALNEVRFEGPGGGGSTVRGHFAESRISVLGNSVVSRHLNKHIDYSQCCAPLPNDENARSLATPTGMVVSADGATLYVAAFGSGKIGIFDTAKLEDDSFVPDTANQITLSAGGPSGLALDETGKFLYVLTRFDNGLSVIDTGTRTEVAHLRMFNPEPASVVNGRPFLYDAAYTSSKGDSSCANCHVFGDMDNLAWDLGNPDGATSFNFGPFKIDAADFGIPASPHYAAMKGPMTTQSMRGMANHGPMHWRGDRTGGAQGVANVQPDGGIFNENAAFTAFNVAFPGLVGRDQPLTAAEMQAFTDFALQITYPPNPIRHLDNSLTADQQAGHDFFFDDTKIVDSVFYCGGCHNVDRNANAGATNKPGFFGTDGSSTFAFHQQYMKVPHLRNMYQKVGMFGMANSNNFLADDPFSSTDPVVVTDPFFGNPNPYMGEQVRGFGFFHDGSVDTMYRFHNILGFLPRPPQAITPLDPGNPANLPITPEGMLLRRWLEAFLMVFDSNLFPAVGQQVTLTRDNAAVVTPRLNLLLVRASLQECEVTARDQDQNGYLYDGNSGFLTDMAAAAPLSRDKLAKIATGPGNAVTFTCVPPDNGRRIALDRDEDGYLDGDERAAGSDPADAASVPGAV